MFNTDFNALETRNDILNSVFAGQGLGYLNNEARARILNKSSVSVLADRNAKSNAKVYFVNNDIVIDFFINNKVVDTVVIDSMNEVDAIDFAQAKLKAILSQRNAA